MKMNKIIAYLLLLTTSPVFAGLPPVSISGQNYLSKPKLNTLVANPVDLSTSNVTGTLPVGNGGTGNTTGTATTNANLTGPISSTGNATAITSQTGTGTTFAMSAGPTFTGTVTHPSPWTLGATSVTSTGTQLNYLNAATGTTGTTSTNLVYSTSPVLVTPSLGVPSLLTLTNATGLPLSTGVTGSLPIANGGTGVTTRADAIAALLPSQAAQSGKLLATTGSAGADPVWSLVSLTSNISGTLPIGNGGTAVTSVTTAPAASSFAGWDANKNLSANRLIPGFRTQATANSTLTLVVGDAYTQYFTGTTAGQIVQLPTTSIVQGGVFNLVNASTQSITINSSGGNLVATLLAGTSSVVTALVATPTTAANWSTIQGPTGASIAPTVQKFTATGAFTYTTPTNPAPLFIKVRMIGGGGGGSGSSNAANGSAGGTGGNTTFGSSLLVANGGVGGSGGGAVNGGAGGTASLGTGPIGTATTGSAGQGNIVIPAATGQATGGQGGTSPFGGAGAGSGTGAGVAAIANTGSGGGGAAAATTGTQYGGSGGGAGGYVEAIITSPLSSYTGSLGIAGTAGGTGTGGQAGGAGGTGYVEVVEYYPAVGTVPGAVAGITPTVQKFTSSSGNYTTPVGVQFIRVRISGSGGGGGGGGTSGGSAGGAGNASTFGTSLLSAGGGSGGAGPGASLSSGGAGGTNTFNSPAIGTSLPGGTGDSNFLANSTTQTAGGMGGSNSLGGGGSGGIGSATGLAGATNTGAGGGGGGSTAVTNSISGAGGGAGGYIDAILVPTAGQVFAYAVGAAGSAGSAGTNGSAGGAGALGYIEVIEYYNGLAVGTTAAVTAGTFLAGPTSGGAAAPTFRALQAPTVQKFTSSSGTYTTAVGALYLRVKMVGGGGGGAGGGTASMTNGVNGGNTTFGTSLLTANGGSLAAINGSLGGSGGTATVSSPAIGSGFTGGTGGPAQYHTSGSIGILSSGFGAGTPFSGSIGGVIGSVTGGAGAPNSGSGGSGGGSTNSGGYAAAGGGAGAFIDAIIPSPSATYSYAVGVAGTAGGAGTSGGAGGAGGTGYIEVTEYYQ